MGFCPHLTYPTFRVSEFLGYDKRLDEELGKRVVCSNTESTAWMHWQAVISANWVDPPKRDRKKNYNEMEYRKAMSATGPKTAGPRIPKIPKMEDFQVRLRERTRLLAHSTPPTTQLSSEIVICPFDDCQWFDH